MLIGIIKIAFLLGFLILIHETGHFFIAKLFNVKVKQFAIGFGPTILKKRGIETSYDANYMARYGKLSTTFNGQLYVLRNAISLDYLWQNVRVLGGAYGSMIRITDDSELLLASYRDPNSNKTNDIFEKIPEFIESLKPSRDDLLKYKIGAIGMLDQDLHPSTKGQVAFSKLVSGKTYEFEKQRRIELLNTTQNDLSKYSIAFRDALMQNYICSLVSKKGMEESKKLYNTRRKLFKNE